MKMHKVHTPVLLKEVLEIFDPQPGETYVDATINGGGHAAAILEKITPGGTLVGIDWDCEIIKAAESQTSTLDLIEDKFQNNKIILVCDNYANLRNIFREYNLDAARGILFDLGFSLYHVTDAKRGFSFQKDEPLDMRYHSAERENLKSNHRLNRGQNPKQIPGSKTTLTAAEMVNNYPKAELERILREYGEERFSRRIAERIYEERRKRKILTTKDLVEVIRRAVPRRYVSAKLHFATRTFQALRIAVNRELENIEKGIGEAAGLLEPGGKIVVISFHSLEDRIVKNFFKSEERSGRARVLTPKPIRPSPEEISKNPRARSAILRAIEMK